MKIVKNPFPQCSILPRHVQEPNHQFLFFSACTRIWTGPLRSVELRSHVANQVYVVIEVAYKVIRDIMCRSASVPDKLPLGHFIFDVGAGEVDGQQDQTVAQHIHGICREMR